MHPNLFISLTLYIVRLINMASKCKVRVCGESLAITIPAQIAKMHDIKKGDYMEISPIGYGEFKIKKISA